MSWFHECLALAKYSKNMTAFIMNIVVIIPLGQKTAPAHCVLGMCHRDSGALS